MYTYRFGPLAAARLVTGRDSMRIKVLSRALAVTAALLSGGAMARADIIGSVWQNQPTAAGNALISYGMSSGGVVGAGNLGASDATFHTTTISYNTSDNPNVYSLGPWLNNPTFTNQSTNFSTGASYTPSDPGGDNGYPAVYGSSGTLNETYILFTGYAYLNAGSNTLDVGHDDGVQLGIMGVTSSAGTGAGGTYAGYSIVLSVPGPTGFASSPFTIIAPTAGLYEFVLAYGETEGPPAALQFLVNGAPPSSAPEPASLTMLGVGSLALMGYSRRRKRKAQVIYTVRGQK